MKQTWIPYLPIIILGLIGLGFLGFGLHELFIPKAPVVEITHVGASPSPTTSTHETAKIVVDVAGAVEHPGVYTLELGSRVSDALVAAGGLSISADKNYLSRSVNLASQVADGSKIYILKKGEAPATPAQTDVATIVPPTTSLISINTAPLSDLDKLWGIGESRAGDIISNRPYASLDELKTKAHIPTSIYDKIKATISL